jgi:hypothetical protein
MYKVHMKQVNFSYTLGFYPQNDSICAWKHFKIQSVGHF